MTNFVKGRVAKMVDMKNVIKAVEEAFDLVHSDFIGTDDFNETEWEQNKTDALKLLKEHEDGHWIVLEYCANEGIYCSKCKNKIFDIATKPKKKLSNFCPNCGSKNTNFFNPSTGKIMYSD